MIDNLRFPLTLIAALGCGLIGGVFFAFSTFVMRALGRLPPAQGISAMQNINVTVINPLFMAAFLGTAALCVLLAILSLTRWQGPGAAWLLAGSVLYLAGNIVVTMAFNVPRNDALAAVDPGSVEGARLWADYLVGWNLWNHVRTVTGLLSAASFMAALR